MLLPLTGPFAAVGVDNQQGVTAALEISSSAVPFDIVYEDTKADPRLAVGAFRKLQETESIIGFYAIRSPIGAALNPISKSSKIPFLGGVGTSSFPQQNEYAFQFWSSTDEEGALLAKIFTDQKYNRIALISTQAEWTSLTSTVFRSHIVDKSTLVYDQEFVPAETDFRTLIAQMKSKNPDVVFINCTLGQIGPFLKQVRDQKLSASFYSNFWVAKKDVIESAGPENVEGVKFVEMDTSLPKFSKVIKEKFNATPSGATLSTYAATLLLRQVFAKDSSIDSAEKLQTALGKETELVTPDGSWPIKDRRVLFPLVERVMRGGKAVPNS